ncbi:hypothetical protein M3936_02680 [Sutcliffiella horikoshii]|uniref:hypothetical protein n=1 Tax=Sutcliffiella horikoshii TaxID=79883 RepID=UPI0007D0B81B|nr:hypothetical protein [Sutcliffiella horikoshii]MCM3616479.1 hypothetical protein [Sutcliffiella horikoshii]
MRKLRKPVRIVLALMISVCLFLAYIHSAKEEVIASAVKESSQNGISLSLQNPYIMPIKVYEATMVDDNRNELPITVYNVQLSGVYSGGESNIDESFMSSQTDKFEVLDEVTIPSDASKSDKIYSIYFKDTNGDGTVENAEKVTVSFKIFSIIPFTTTISI